MWKNSLAIIAIGSLVTGSSFATPIHFKKMFMKEPMKSMLISNKYTQNSQFKFTGTWTGMCSSDNNKWETKLQIDEDDTNLTIIDLVNAGHVETDVFDAVKSESYSDKNWYNSFSSRLTKVNDNTLKSEGTGMFTNQLPSSNLDSGFQSGIFTAIYSVNNDQLIIDTNIKIIEHGNENVIEDKCILKRVK
jgi:hypothetical protein